MKIKKSTLLKILSVVLTVASVLVDGKCEEATIEELVDQRIAERDSQNLQRL